MKNDLINTAKGIITEAEDQPVQIANRLQLNLQQAKIAALKKLIELSFRFKIHTTPIKFAINSGEMDAQEIALIKQLFKDWKY